MNTNKKGSTKAGDPTFQEELLGLVPFLRAFARTLTGKQETADDLAQETLAKAWQYRGSFIPGTNLKAWLFTILRNQFYSDTRRSWRKVDWNEEAAAHIPAAEGSSQIEARCELHRTLWAMAKYLSEDQRDALMAVGFLGHEYGEAATMLNCAVGTVKSRVARARKELKDLLEGQELIGYVDLSTLKTRAKNVPEDHPFRPVALGYETLYATVDGDVRKYSPKYGAAGVRQAA